MATDQYIQTKATTRYDTDTGKELIEVSQNVAYVKPEEAPPGIGGFVFNIVTDDTIELSSQITDHYTENNLSMQDHIALDAPKVTVRGLVGEIESLPPNAEQRSPSIGMADVPDFMAADPSLGKDGTGGTNEMYTSIIKNVSDAYNKIDKIEKQKNRTINNFALGSIYSAYKQKVPRNTNQGKQEYVFRFFFTAWRSKILFTVETPWGIFDKMAIERIHVNQGEASRFMSDFTLSFKQIRTAKDIKGVKALGRASQQTADTQNNGTSQTVSVEKPTAPSANNNPPSPSATPGVAKVVKKPVKWFTKTIKYVVRWVLPKTPAQ